MGLEGVDLPAIGGGLSILGAMIFVIRVAFIRLDKQDSAWIELLGATERRAESAEETLADLRKAILEDRKITEQLRKESREEIRRLGEQLKEAKLQIKELQKWNGET